MVIWILYESYAKYPYRLKKEDENSVDDQNIVFSL